MPLMFFSQPMPKSTFELWGDSPNCSGTLRISSAQQLRPLSFRNFAMAFVLLFFLAFFLFPHTASAEENPAPESAVSPQPAAADPAAISIPVPEGQDVMGIRIPHHNERGELIMLITADVARKAGDTEIEMERMKIDLWDDERRMASLSMPKSRFKIESRVLSGTEGALIERDDFTIEGDNLEFDLAAQKGIMRGKVTMTIKQAEELTQ